MNRKQKIIVSVTGIFLVILILLGITYAYFLTQITGNTNGKSISITTANLELTYQDASDNIVLTKLIPGETVGTKVFTIENTGTGTVENYGIYVTDLVYDFETPSMVYTLTCTNSDGSSCEGASETAFPTTNDLLISNDIEEDNIQTYTLTIKYNETDTDQSADKEKKFSGKLQVFDLNEVVDIEGTVAQFESGDFVEINSVVVKSNINKDGKYKLSGILPGDHTLYLKNKSGGIKGSKAISIVDGTTESIDGTVVNVKGETQTIELNINSVDTTNKTLDLNIDSVNKYNKYNETEDSLALNILNNAEKNNQLVSESISASGHALSGVNFDTDVTKVQEVEEVTMTIESQFLDDYWTYSNEVGIDKRAGFYMKNPSTCVYQDCYTSLVGTYMFAKLPYINAKSKNIEVNTYGFANIYQVVSATLEKITFKELSPTIIEVDENSLVSADDDYGTTYYFRGNVNNNYVNFANMCWRIVRINDDRSVKLVLEDKNNNCQNSTGAYSVGKGVFGHNIKTTFDNSSYIEIDYLNSSVDGMAASFKTFQQNALNNYLDRLKAGDWCYEDATYSDTSATALIENPNNNSSDTSFYYKKFQLMYHFSGHSFKCTGTSLNDFDEFNKMYVGALTTDEVAFAGATRETNDNYYLVPLSDKSLRGWWTLTPSYFAKGSSLGAGRVNVINMGRVGRINVDTANSSNDYRPSVNLKSGINIISGNGTINSPYVVE